MANKRYKYYQPNKKDLKDKRGDCSLRALTKFFGIQWIDAYDILSAHARLNQTMPNDIENIKEVMDERGYAYTSVSKQKITISELASKINQDAVAYCRAGFGTHMVAISEHNYFDTWDCGNKLAYGYWIKGESEVV